MKKLLFAMSLISFLAGVVSLFTGAIPMALSGFGFWLILALAGWGYGKLTGNGNIA